MIEKDDWRLTGQMRTMFQKRLFFRTWSAPSITWDHDHCAFCFAKFTESMPGTLREGYATEDNRHWICPDCFRDFHEMFEWMVSEEDRSKSIVDHDGTIVR